MSDAFEQRRSPLFEGLPKYQHVERLGHEDVEGLLDGEVVVQEKLDGANATVAMVDDRLVIASRHQALSINEVPRTGFRGLVAYVISHTGIRELLRARPELVLRGEWLVHHSLVYHPVAYGQFYVFDVQDRSRDFDYLHPDEYYPLLQERGILLVPEVARLASPTVAQLAELTTGPSALGPEKEGIVVKRYGFRNKWGRVTWGKLVSADFKEKNRLHFRPTAQDPDELRFAAKATREFIIKTINTVADQKGESPRVQHMPAVMGRVWHDLFTEELWDFVKREKVKQFNFLDARRLVEQKTRDVALAYYNGIPSIHG